MATTLQPFINHSLLTYCFYYYCEGLNGLNGYKKVICGYTFYYCLLKIGNVMRGVGRAKKLAMQNKPFIPSTLQD